VTRIKNVFFYTMAELSARRLYSTVRHRTLNPLGRNRRCHTASKHWHSSLHFWATVCKTVRLCYRTVVCLFCLSITVMYCGQTVGWIKMKLGTEVGLVPDHIVSDGDPASPPPRGSAPNFQPMSVVAKRLDGSRCHLVGR